jgi:secreted PhoX family phosphatase
MEGFGKIGRGVTRRGFLKTGAGGVAYAALAQALVGCGSSDSIGSGGGGSCGPGRLCELGPLQAPDENGLMLPAGFQSRVIATANRRVGNTLRLWHTDPDGGATYPTDDGGWIYVSNREFLPGGVNAIRFDPNGEIIDAYNILNGLLTRINCAGGVTPWGTWMSCEEYDLGIVWECDPYGREAAQARRALGTFSHEAIAVDPATNIIYETEDQSDGRFYRFIPDSPNVGGRPDLSSGTLQAMRVLIDEDTLNSSNKAVTSVPFAVDWLDVPNPNPVLGGVLVGTPTRQQLPESTRFRGGEGIWYHQGIIYFTTKSDRRVWAHDIAAQTVKVIYDDDWFEDPILDSVDNIVVTPGGDVVVVEDKTGEQDVVAIAPDGGIIHMVRQTGHPNSELTGPAFSPDGRHFYFSSQRGATASGPGIGGVTYCVTGDWYRL